MRFTQDHESLHGAEVIDNNGDRIGDVGQVYLNDTSGEVEWVTVRTGLFGMKETLVPMAGASVRDGQIVVPHEKAFIKDAPNVDVDAHLDEAQQNELFAYYGDPRATGDGVHDGVRDGAAGMAGVGTMAAGSDDLAMDRGITDDRAFVDEADADRTGTDRMGTDTDEVGLEEHWVAPDQTEESYTGDRVMGDERTHADDRTLGDNRDMGDQGLGSGQGFGTSAGMATDDELVRGEARDNLTRDDMAGDDLARDGDRLDGDRNLVNDRDMVADPRNEGDDYVDGERGPGERREDGRY
ncbi:PRC-barrel domain-containing protein [Ornithinimicrobium panacihumi]|uniref:PRC-barrel domain-containing protein n=1 Tax=Ornithinimicrobium panacihumi TaxID=2008449 RepID=UPI003F88EB70